MEEKLSADPKSPGIETKRAEISISEQSTSNKKKSNKRLVILISILSGIFILLSAGLYWYVYRDSYRNPISLNELSITPTLNPAFKDLPKFAYIYTFGSKLIDSDPDVGGVFIVSADGSQKKITTIKKEDMQGVLTNVIYSQFVDKLLINTDKALIQVDPKTGEQKDIYKGKIWRVSLTKDGKYVCPSIDGEDIKIQLDNLKVTPDNTDYEKSFFQNECEKDKQPMFDEKNNLLVDVRTVDFTDAPVGRIIDSSEFSVTNKTTGEVKRFKYNKSGSIDPIFIQNNYLYFRTQGCCAGTPFMEDLMQLDLKTGEVSEPTSIPLVKNEIDKVKKFKSTFTDKSRRGASIEGASVSPSGKYLIYKTSYPDGEVYVNTLYLYDVENGKATEIEKAIGSEVGGFSEWTSDGRYLYISNFIYDTETGKKYDVNYNGPNEFLVFIK